MSLPQLPAYDPAALLPAPCIRQAPDCIVDAHFAFATIIVPVYSGKAGNDRITVTCGDGPSGWSSTLTVWEHRAGEICTVKLDAEWLMVARGRILDLGYDVMRASGRIEQSRRRAILFSAAPRVPPGLPAQLRLIETPPSA